MRLLLLCVLLGHVAAPPAPGVVGLPASCLAAVGPRAAGEPPSGHAHNDYEHERPVADALSSGFTSLEVDVWAVAGRLLVGHSQAELDPRRTLERLYLAPLARRLHRRGPPSAGPPLQLLVDVKSDAAQTVPLVEAALDRHRELLTSYRGCRVHPRAAAVVLSGNARPGTSPQRGVERYTVDYQPEREGALDLPPAAVRLVSLDWSEAVGDGDGPVPGAATARLREYVDAAHERGAAVRVWNAPDEAGEARTAAWTAMSAAGVDYVGTDDLRGYRTFLRR